MTVHELSRLYYIKKLIDRQKEKLDDCDQYVAELEARLQPGGMDMSGMPHNPTPVNTFELTMSQLLDAKEKREREKEKYNKIIAEFEDEKARLEEFLTSVSDCQIRLMLLYRFVDLLSWQKIALKIGGNNTEESVKMACYRYLKKN